MFGGKLMIGAISKRMITRQQIAGSRLRVIAIGRNIAGMIRSQIVKDTAGDSMIAGRISFATIRDFTEEVAISRTSAGDKMNTQMGTFAGDLIKSMERS
jgi:hypothetical protein